MQRETIKKVQSTYLAINKSQTKFKQYLQNKLSKIQQTKANTMKLTSQYFGDIKQKLNRYLIKEEKKLLTSYQDSINKSINCLNYNYLNLIQKNVICRQILTRSTKPTKQAKQNLGQNTKVKSQLQNLMQIRKKSIDEQQNEISIKLQIKKLLTEMLVSQNLIIQKTKIIGQIIKKQVKQLTTPLQDLFTKIPTLIKIESQITAQKQQIHELKHKKTNTNNIKKHTKTEMIKIKQQEKQIKITQKLLQKSHLTNKSLLNLNQNKIKLITLSKKDDQLQFMKYKNNQQLLDFNFINNKCLIRVFKTQYQQRQLILNQIQNVRDHINQNNIHQIDQNQDNMHQANIHQNRLNVYINQTAIFGFCKDKHQRYTYTNYCNIQFQSKPNRQYLLLIVQKTQTIINQDQNLINEHQIIIKVNRYQFIIYNYHGDQITRWNLNVQIPITQKVIGVHQICSKKQYFYIVFNNRIIRYDFNNINQAKSILYGSNYKIIKSQVSIDRLIVFELKQNLIKIIDQDLNVIQTFSWLKLRPLTNNIPQFKNIYFQDHNLNRTLTLLLENSHLSELYYLQNGIKNSIKIQILRTGPNTKNGKINGIQYIIQIQNNIYLILSRYFGQSKFKSSLYLLQIEQIQHNYMVRYQISHLQNQSQPQKLNNIANHKLNQVESHNNNRIQSHNQSRGQSNNQNGVNNHPKCQFQYAIRTDKQLIGKIYFLQNFKQQVVQIKYFLNKLYIHFKSGKNQLFSLA